MTLLQPSPPRRDRRPVLIVLHQASSTPGRVGQWLVSEGYRLDIRRPALGDSLPRTTQDHSAVVIFGGPMSANDTDAYIKQEIDFINIPLREETPFFGICLGAQMLARTLGGRVGPRHDGLVEIGYYDIEPTDAGKSMMDWPRKVYQWHREGFETPKDAVLLAKGRDYDQAFKVGPCAYGIQFHPEITLAMLYRWTTRGHERMSLPGARKRADHFRGRAVFDPPVKAWLAAFMKRFLVGSPSASPAAAGDDVPVPSASNRAA
ncbi:MAG: glutamine amidotransferase [Pseudomonadota bacterium]